MRKNLVFVGVVAGFVAGAVVTYLLSSALKKVSEYEADDPILGWDDTDNSITNWGEFEVGDEDFCDDEFS